ncbi:MAG: hypothetical protein L3K00_07755 [Thermoplasmata archaeon]|nr:hypothetical protein [Thermoplasmata archaeon]
MTGLLDALRPYFPTPFVAIVALLVVLIVLTPNLLSSAAPSAGSLPTEAELEVDRVVGGNATHFYVRGLGDVRYTSIAVSLAANFSWPAPPSMGNLSFGRPVTETNVLVTLVTTGANPVAVNVTAVYVDAAGTQVSFVGVFAFDLAAGILYETPYIPAGSGSSATPVDDLPLSFLLETVPAGGSL